MSDFPSGVSEPTLAAWLLKQIAADEAVARAATEGPWRRGMTRSGFVSVEGPPWTIAGNLAENDATHIARQSPAHVLAVCEAHRHIVQACEPIYGTDGWEYDDAPELAWTTLRALAAIYADRGGFREEWR